MSELMNISVNGQSQVPPGFRFHPTEEELLHYYLRKKISHEKIDLDVIRDVDLNKLEPWDIQERCKIGSAGQTDWYLFSHKDKKYPSGTRMNRATAAGFWKATGRDKEIYSSRNMIGLRKTLVFYTGRAPRGLKSDWIMYEYRLLDRDDAIDSQIQEKGWVVCRIFKKRSHQQKGYAAEARTKLMAEEKKVETVIKGCDWLDDEYAVVSTESDGSDTITKWGEVDQLVAGQLNGQTETGDEQSCFDVDVVDTKIVCAPALPYLAHHHQQLQFQSFSSFTNHNQICTLWGFT